MSNRNQVEFQLKHFEDFFIGSDEDRFKLNIDIDLDLDSNNKFNSRRKSKKLALMRKNSQLSDDVADSHFQRNRINFYGLTSNDDNEKLGSSRQAQNLKKDILLYQKKKEKERSGSSDTLQLLGQSPENE